MEWATPVVFALNEDGDRRFCVENGQSNALTVGERYPVPNMNERIDSVASAALFPNLDANLDFGK